MPKSVRRKPNTSDTQLLPEYLEIPFKVPNGDGCIIICAERKAHQNVLTHLMTPQMFTKFAGKGYKALSSPFPHYFENQVVEVYTLFRQSQNLTRPKPTVKNRKRNKVSPKYIYSPSGYRMKPLVPHLAKLQQAANLVARKRR